ATAQGNKRQNPVQRPGEDLARLKSFIRDTLGLKYRGWGPSISTGCNALPKPPRALPPTRSFAPGSKAAPTQSREKETKTAKDRAPSAGTPRCPAPLSAAPPVRDRLLHRCPFRYSCSDALAGGRISGNKITWP